MKKIILVIFLILLPSVQGQRDNERTNQIEEILEIINESLVGEYLKTIVDFGPRMTGTYGCEKAAQYIYDQFKKMGLETRYHNWTAFGNIYHPRLFKSQNIEATLKGDSDKIIIFNAHYDTSKESPGANDDGSGTAAVLAAAFALSHFKFRHTLKFIAFSGEEVGVIGSEEYVKEAYKRNDKIVVDLNADCIGYAKTLEGGRRMRIFTTEDAKWIEEVIEKVNFNINFQLNFGDIDREGREHSDYSSFVKYGYEAIAFWGGESYPYGHTPEDDFDKINLSYLVKITRIITGTMAYLASMQDFPPQIRIKSPKRGKLYFEGMKRINIQKLKTIVIDDIWIWAEERVSNVSIERVEFYYDDRLVFTDTSPPFKWHFNKLSIRKHRITVIAYDKFGRSSKDWRDIYFINLLRKR